MSAQSTLPDRVGGLIWVVFGAAVVAGSWRMDRLESLGIPPATAPGVPTGLLGAALMAFGLVMLVRRGPAATLAYQDAVATEAAAATPAPEFDWRRAGLSGLLCLAYAGALLGRGLPYWLLTAGFLFLHLVLLDETERVPARPSPRRILTAAILAPAVTAVVMLVFQQVFLVRLP